MSIINMIEKWNPSVIVFKIAAISIMLALVFFAGWNEKAKRCELDKSETVKAALVAAQLEYEATQDKANTVAKDLQTALAKQRENNRVLNRSMDKILATRSYEPGCVVGADVVRTINAAAGAETGDASGGSDGEMSETR